MKKNTFIFLEVMTEKQNHFSWKKVNKLEKATEGGSQTSEKGICDALLIYLRSSSSAAPKLAAMSRDRLKFIVTAFF